jgi:hypothetical protein
MAFAITTEFYFFSWLSSVPPAKCWDSTSIRPRSLPPNPPLFLSYSMVRRHIAHDTDSVLTFNI